MIFHKKKQVHFGMKISQEMKEELDEASIRYGISKSGLLKSGFKRTWGGK